ncbi:MULTISPECIES: maleylpyruvate isomerase family mycothiol-dependent enzyme [unclassified Embleya]|uniref:maleylpyruvate isomerase family mycothiol-dependent enzyme n=1 Tax=unclassified Embleya TaxID=2699296 RepID=UPI0033CBE52A
MEYSRYLDCLAADYARLRALAALAPAGAVPTCPGWTVADLTRHVGGVYLHKTLSMRQAAEPDPWPPKGLADEEPLALLERSYAALCAEFAARSPQDPAGTWYGPDQTVGFWIRRMAQETVVHRIDAELGAGQTVVPIPDDLAVDGVDELLKIFVAYGVGEWADHFTDLLIDSPGRRYLLRTDGAAWRVRTGPGLFAVEDATVGAESGDDATDVTISGPPSALLRWVWNRTSPGEASGVTIEGAPEAVEELQGCIVVAGQ